MRLILFSVLVFVSFAVAARCECKCVNGNVQAICSSTLDMKPLCSPNVCPLVTPSVQPLQTPMVPPIGTSNCEKQQVYNAYTRKYEWKTLCS